MIWVRTGADYLYSPELIICTRQSCLSYSNLNVTQPMLMHPICAMHTYINHALEKVCFQNDSNNLARDRDLAQWIKECEGRS